MPAQRIEQIVNFLRGHFLVVIVVDLNYRRCPAGCEALDTLEAEESVLGYFAKTDSKGALEVVNDYVRTAEVARDVDTDLDVKPPNRVLAQERVKGRGA